MPQYVGRIGTGGVLRAPASPRAPRALSLYAATLGARNPEWRLSPFPVFQTKAHTFIAMFCITHLGIAVHPDGTRRLLGITTSNDAYLGSKKEGSQAPYAWTRVTHLFRDTLTAWFKTEYGVLDDWQ